MREPCRKSTGPGGGSWAPSRKSWAETTRAISLQARAIQPSPEMTALHMASPPEVDICSHLASPPSLAPLPGGCPARGMTTGPSLPHHCSFHFFCSVLGKKHPIFLLAAELKGSPFPAWLPSALWPVLTKTRHNLRKIPAPHLEGCRPLLWAATHPA